MIIQAKEQGYQYCSSGKCQQNCTADFRCYQNCKGNCRQQCTTSERCYQSCSIDGNCRQTCFSSECYQRCTIGQNCNMACQATDLCEQVCFSGFFPIRQHFIGRLLATSQDTQWKQSPSRQQVFCRTQAVSFMSIVKSGIETKTGIRSVIQSRPNYKKKG